MRGKMKAFRFHYEHWPLLFSAVYAVHFLHNNLLLLQYAPQLFQNNSKWALHQGYGDTTNTTKMTEKHSGEELGQRVQIRKLLH